MKNEQAPLYAVLGATGGIGSELCRTLARQGARLFVGSRSPDSLAEIERDCGATARQVDASDFDDVDRFFSEIASGGVPLSGVVNCVGSLLLKPAHQTTRAAYEETIDANLTTAFATVRSSVSLMRQNGGSIVLISSAAARIGLPNHEAITAAKAGVAALAISAAATYASWDVRVNAVAPGLVRTPMTASIVENEIQRKASTSLHALGRIGEPQDVASLIAWLLSEESSWVTGQVWSVDGGLSSLKTRPAR